MWAIIFSGIFIFSIFLSEYQIFHKNAFTFLLAILALFYWIYFFFGAIFIHRKAPLGVEEIERLVKRGVYAKVRHPIYSADVILSWGIFMLFPYSKILISVLWLTAVQLYWMKLEEKALTEKFGEEEEYEKYKKQVPMMIPRIRIVLF